MRPTRAFQVLLLAAALASSTACEKDKKKRIEYQYAVTLTAQLELDLRYPNFRDRDATCPGAASWLLRLDETGDSDWEYSLLFSSDFSTLYGCGGQALACPTPVSLALRLANPPARAMLEGLTIVPDQYVAAASGINVTCRGIADSTVVPGDVSSTPIPLPTDLPNPGPEPTAVPNVKHTLTLRMLSVGNSNPLPYESGGPAPADLRFGAGASFSNRRFDLAMGGGAEAGIAVFGGGVSNSGIPSASIWEFEPRTLTFTSSGSLGLARAGLTATAFVDATGPAIAFAGGAAEGVLKSPNINVYRLTANETFTMAAGRAFHTAAYLPRGAAGPAIALVGGGNFTVATQSYGTGTDLSSEWLKPAGTTISSCGVALGATGLCTGPAMGVARMRSGSASYLAGTAGRLWVYGGANDSTQHSAWTELDSPGAGSFLSEQASSPATLSAAGVLLSETGNTTINGVPILIGGHELRVGDSAANWAAMQVGGVVTTFTRKPALKRGTATAVELRDKTALLIGGKDTGALGGIAPLERLEPTTNLTAVDAVQFSFLPVPGETCDTVTGNLCASLVEPRWGHTSIRLDATQTWLDGAVLIIGGGADSGVSAELFVPAMTCDATEHLNPVSPLTQQLAEPLTNLTLPSLCDRDRAGEEITDPSNPPPES